MTDAGTTETRALNCTSCGAALRLLGGHRARSITCGTCGAVMDAHEDYCVLARYRDMYRPATPLGIGDTGTLYEVTFTVIGIIGMVSRDDWGEYRWVDHQIYSPTHGYCWLTLNKGHWAFSRKVRTPPDAADPFVLSPKLPLSAMGRDYQVFETFEAEIEFVEGEFTWIPTREDRVQVVEAIAPPHLFAVQRSGEEIEYEATEYLPPDWVAQGFGVGEVPRREGVHPAQPFEPGRLHVAFATAGRFFLPIVALAALAALFLGDGRQIARATFGPVGGALDFEVTDPERLHRMRIVSPVQNGWTYYEITLSRFENGEEEDIAEFGREISYYEGRDADGSWTEGSRVQSAAFTPGQAGTYRVTVTPTEAERPAGRTIVSVHSGMLTPRYFAGLAAIFGFAWLSLAIRRSAFEKKRWGDDDEDDEDD